MASGKQLMALLATSSSLVSLAAGQNLATLTPFAGAEPVTVTSQYQVVPSCELSTTTVESTVTESGTASVTSQVQTIPLCTPSTFVSTAVPTYSNYVRGSTVVSSIEQPVTFNRADFTISASALPSPSLNATRNATVTAIGGRRVKARQLAGTVIDIKSYQDYDRLGALAIPNYDGSGLCTECGPDSRGALTQVYTVVSCSSTIGGTQNCTTFPQTEIASPTSYSAPGGTVTTITTTNTFGPTSTPTEAMPGAGNPGGVAPTGYGSYGSYGSYGGAGSGNSGYGSYGSYGSYGNTGSGAGGSSGDYGSYGSYGSYGNVDGSAAGSPAPGSPYYAPSGSNPAFYPGPAGSPVPIAYPPGQSTPVPYPWIVPGPQGAPTTVTTTLYETITVTTTVPASTYLTTSMSSPPNGGAPVTVTATVTAPASTVTETVTQTTTTTVVATPTSGVGNPQLCPQFDGQIIGSSTGATYLVECGRAIVGTEITGVTKRQANPGAPTVDVCINLCCSIDSCVAINLTPNGCQYFSSFTGTVVSADTTALFQEACPAKKSTSSSMASTTTGSFATTSTGSGTVTSTGSVSPVPTSAVCPAYDGQDYTDSEGNTYAIDCNTALEGTRIDTGMKRRQIAISISICFDVCCGMDECVGVNYNPSGFCEYFSFISGTSASFGFIAAGKLSCGNPSSSTSSSLSSPTSSGSFMTTSTNSFPTSSGSFMTTSSNSFPTSSGSFMTTSSNSFPTSSGSFMTTSSGSFVTSSSSGSFATTSSGSFVTSAPSGSFATTSSGSMATTTTSSSEPAGTAAVCPQDDGQDHTDSSGNTYAIGCDSALTGTLISSTGMRRRQALSFSTCADTCCRLSGCVGINYTPSGCQYFSSISGMAESNGTVAAEQVGCSSGSSTTSSMMSMTTSGSLLPTGVTSVVGPVTSVVPVVTNSTTISATTIVGSVTSLVPSESLTATSIVSNATTLIPASSTSVVASLTSGLSTGVVTSAVTSLVGTGPVSTLLSTATGIFTNTSTILDATSTVPITTLLSGTTTLPATTILSGTSVVPVTVTPVAGVPT